MVAAIDKLKEPKLIAKYKSGKVVTYTGYPMVRRAPLRFGNQRPIHIELINPTATLISHCLYGLHPVGGKLLVEGKEVDRYGR